MGGFVTNLGCFSLIWGSFYVKLVFWESARPGVIFGPSRPGPGEFSAQVGPSWRNLQTESARSGPEPNGRDFKHWSLSGLTSRREASLTLQCAELRESPTPVRSRDRCAISAPTRTSAGRLIEGKTSKWPFSKFHSIAKFSRTPDHTLF